jgi:hypothetical protein
MTSIAQHVTRIRRASHGLAAGALLAVLAGCGGGAYVEIAGPPPDISVATSVTSAQRGDPLQLVAAVSASNGIDYVSFYRIDFGGPVLLGTVSGPPANWDTSVPFNAAGSVTYFASVCDLLGYCTSSVAVTVFVYP